jgi:hypothetical protein
LFTATPDTLIILLFKIQISSQPPAKAMTMLIASDDFNCGALALKKRGPPENCGRLLRSCLKLNPNAI